MCGRSSLSKTEKELEKRFGASFYSDALVQYNPLPSYNVAPSHFHPVITNEFPNTFQFFKWGFIPVWAKEEKIGFKMINARKETLLEKASFKSAVKYKRCLVPFDGFYEWKKEGKQKTPFHIQTTDQDVFAVAGLWSNWTTASGATLSTFTLITQTPNQLVGNIHNRMPAILLPGQEKDWLDINIPAKDAIQMLLPYPEEHMRAYPVSNRVNNVRENDKDLLKEIKEVTNPQRTLFD